MSPVDTNRRIVGILGLVNPEWRTKFQQLYLSLWSSSVYFRELIPQWWIKWITGDWGYRDENVHQIHKWWSGMTIFDKSISNVCSCNLGRVKITFCVALLTHWGRVTHICVSKLTIIGSDNGLSPGRRWAIIWTNDWILLIRPIGTNFSEISIEILTFSFKKTRLKLSSAKWRPFCLGLNVLKILPLSFLWSDAIVIIWHVWKHSMCDRMHTMRLCARENWPSYNIEEKKTPFVKMYLMSIVSRYVTFQIHWIVVENIWFVDHR